MSQSTAWRTLALPAPIEAERVRAVLVGLASLPGQPRVVLEATGEAGSIRWRLGAPLLQIGAALRVLKVHLPELRSTIGSDVEEVEGEREPLTAASLRLPGSRRLPLGSADPEATTRAVLAALARTPKDERLNVQVVLGPRLRPRRIRDVDPAERALVTRKHGEHGFGCAVRISATASDLVRAESLVRSVGAALGGLSAPGVGIALVGTSTSAVARAASPWFWPLWLSVSDLVPLLAWPTAPLPLPGVPSPHPRLLPAGDYPSRGSALGQALEPSGRPVALSAEDRLRHLHVIGPSGVGKSTLLANLALGDIAAGYGLVVIDPKGDLVEDIASRLPVERQRDVVILDPGGEAVIGLNGLHDPVDADRTADVLLGVFHNLYADSWGPRTHDILHACLLTLARRGDASLAMVPLLLTDPGFRRSVTGKVAAADPMGLGSFWAWYEGTSEGERQQAIARS